MIRDCFTDFDEGQRDSVCQRHHVLQGERKITILVIYFPANATQPTMASSSLCIAGAKPNPRGGQRGRLRGFREVVGRDHVEERAGNSQLGRHPLTEGDHCKRDAGGNVCFCCPRCVCVLIDKMCVIAQDTLVEGTAAWGVQVERVEVGLIIIIINITTIIIIS